MYGSPDALVLQLQRSQCVDGTWTKHSSELDIGHDINLPFSDDGHNVHYGAYRIVGLVLHQGEDHLTGHYQSILLMDNIIWLADDGDFPSPLAELTEQ